MKIVVIPDMSCIPAAALMTLKNPGLTTFKEQRKDFPRLVKCKYLTAYYFDCVGKRFVLQEEEIGTINEVATGEYDEARGMWMPRMLVQVDWDKENVAERLVAPGAKLRVAQKTLMASLDNLRREAVMAVEAATEEFRRLAADLKPGDIIPSDSGIELVEVKITDELSIEVLADHADTAEAMATALRGMIEEDDDALAEATV